MFTGQNYHGLIPAIALPFTSDYQIDEAELRKLAKWLVEHKGVVGVMTNGHTGEVFSLDSSERAEVTRIVADEVGDRTIVVSSIVCEGIRTAVQDARAAKDAGAQALDIMPPHHWLRFGYQLAHVMEYFDAIADATELDLIVHVYPAWTKAAYSADVVAALARLPYVKAFKMGERDMNRYARDIQTIRNVDPTKALLTCHDEYLLASMIQGIDGALVGFGTFIPGLISDLLTSVKAGDLKGAMEIQKIIDPLKQAVYGNGEPTGEAHARMKVAMKIAGILKNSTSRRPTTGPNAVETEQIRLAVEGAGLLNTAIPSFAHNRG